MGSIPSLLQTIFAGVWTTAASESDTDRNGLLSYAGERHSFILGLGAGILFALTAQPNLALLVAAYALGEQKGNGWAFREIYHEPWYAIGGVLVGLVGGIYLLAPHIAL